MSSTKIYAVFSDQPIEHMKITRNLGKNVEAQIISNNNSNGASASKIIDKRHIMFEELYIEISNYFNELENITSFNALKLEQCLTDELKQKVKYMDKNKLRLILNHIQKNIIKLRKKIKSSKEHENILKKFKINQKNNTNSTFILKDKILRQKFINCLIEKKLYALSSKKMDIVISDRAPSNGGRFFDDNLHLTIHPEYDKKIASSHIKFDGNTIQLLFNKNDLFYINYKAFYILKEIYKLQKYFIKRNSSNEEYANIYNQYMNDNYSDIKNRIVKILKKVNECIDSIFILKKNNQLNLLEEAHEAYEARESEEIQEEAQEAQEAQEDAEATEEDAEATEEEDEDEEDEEQEAEKQGEQKKTEKQTIKKMGKKGKSGKKGKKGKRKGKGKGKKYKTQKAQGEQASKIKLTNAQIMIEKKIIKQKEYDEQEKLINEKMDEEFKIMEPFINNKIIKPYNNYFIKINNIIKNLGNYMKSIRYEAYKLQENISKNRLHISITELYNRYENILKEIIEQNKIFLTNKKIYDKEIEIIWAKFNGEVFNNNISNINIYNISAYFKGILFQKYCNIQNIKFSLLSEMKNDFIDTFFYINDIYKNIFSNKIYLTTNLLKIIKQIYEINFID